MVQSRALTGLLAAMTAALMAVALMAPVAQAAEPAPGYAQFAGCPSPEENSDVEFCTRSVVKSGHFQMGSKTVQITDPIELSGGLTSDLKIAFNSKGGLNAAQQQVPGGVIGITGLDWLVNFLDVDALQLFAVTELAGTPQLKLDGLRLPIKVRLVNPVLGKNCYVGSTANPIVLELTTGTTNPPPPNEPITGKEVEESISEEPFVIHGKNGTFVDNAFSAPAASGCKLTLLGFLPISLDGLVNSQAGLPAAAGTNETVQNFDLETTVPSLVYP
jgi:hypothetical protein